MKYKLKILYKNKQTNKQKANKQKQTNKQMLLLLLNKQTNKFITEFFLQRQISNIIFLNGHINNTKDIYICINLKSKNIVKNKYM